MTLRLPAPWLQALTSGGVPIAGAKLYFYASGTVTPQNTYSDAALTVANANPVVADSGGFFGDIFLSSGNYKAVLTDSSGVTIRTIDPIPGDSSVTSAATAGGAAGNLLVNPGAAVAQRAPGSVSDAAYSLDGWCVLTQTGAVAFSQLSNPENGQATAARFTQSQATAQRFGVVLPVESVNCRHLRGAAVAAAGRVRFSTIGVIRYALLEWTGTADAITRDVVADWTSASYAPGGFFLLANTVVVAKGSVTATAATWTDLPVITGTVSGSMNNLLLVIWTEQVAAQNATLDIGKLRLAAGSTDPGFVPRDYGDDLQRCQRTYQTGFGRWDGSVTSGGTYSTVVSYKVTMRAVPTVALTTGGGDTGFAAGNPSQMQGDATALIVGKTANATTGGIFSFAFTASAEL